MYLDYIADFIEARYPSQVKVVVTESDNETIILVDTINLIITNVNIFDAANEAARNLKNNKNYKFNILLRYVDHLNTELPSMSEISGMTSSSKDYDRWCGTYNTEYTSKCLGAGTPIVCGEKLQRVETLTSGSLISTLNPRNLWSSDDLVKKLHITENDDRDLIKFTFNDPDQPKDFIIVTYDHEFPTSSGNKMAEDITLEDKFISQNNDYIDIKKIDRFTSSGYPTYDITCVKYHTYMIGKHHIMSHNCGVEPNRSDRRLSLLARLLSKAIAYYLKQSEVKVTFSIKDGEIESVTAKLQDKVDTALSLKLTTYFKDAVYEWLDYNFPYIFPSGTENDFIKYMLEDSPWETGYIELGKKLEL
jgi:hypothetical protein